MKICTKCGTEKELNEFYKNKNSKDGYSWDCKSCNKEYQKINYLNKKDNKIKPELDILNPKICNFCNIEKDLTKDFIKDKSYKDGYQKMCKKCCYNKRKNRSKITLPFKICNKCNIEKDINEFHKDYRSVDGHVGQCKECIKLKTKIYNIKISNIKKEKNDLSYSELMENRVKKCYMCNINKPFDDFYLSKKLKTGYRNECKDCSVKYSVNYILDYRKNDPLKLLSDKIRSNILHSFKKAGFRKSNRTQEILGCSFEYFRTYIMSKFEPWMSFENHGKYNGTYNYGWDLDHIIPISSAITEYDIIKLNHYSNFQPLCSKINRFEKKDKLEYIIKK